MSPLPGRCLVYCVLYRAGRCFLGSKGLAQCLCDSGFTGHQCEYRTDACHSRPCRHGGLCLDTGNGAFKCVCPAGYASARCEARLSAGCAARPCLNAGVCRPASRNGRVPHCICPEGYDHVERNTHTHPFNLGSFPVRKRTGMLRIWRAREREPIWESGGGAPSGVHGGRSPPEAEGILLRREQICHSHLNET